MFSTVLWQILNFKELSSETISQVQDTLFNSDSLSLEVLCQAIERTASTLNVPFYFVIDGIDESDDWVEIGGQNKFEQWASQFAQLHILLVGRRPILRSVLAKHPSIELSEYVTRGDISTFIEHKVQNSPNLNDISENVGHLVQQIVQERSTGMFLWVDLIFKELQHCHDSDSVRDCLQDIPTDLEAEYARLLSRLMRRLHSPVGRPRSPMKSARELLALIMSALEPLTIDDLRYGYAASCGKGQQWETNLISREAVLDLIGDFITCTGTSTQYVHFCHSSLEEFLRLPREKWTHSLESVAFFRLEDMECHKLMAHACLEYLKNFDFGYPLVEGGYRNLSKKDFLVYAVRNFPLHLSHPSLRAKESSSMLETLLGDLMPCPNFGGLVEFCLISSQETDLLAGYAGGLLGISLDDFIPALTRRIAEEGRSRLGKFGADDPRTQSWVPIQAAFSEEPLWPPGLDSHQLRHLQRITLADDPEETLSQMLIPPLAHDEVAFQATRPHVRTKVCDSAIQNIAAQSNIHGIVLARALPQAVQICNDPKVILSRVARSLVAKLPIIINLLYARSLFHSDKELTVHLADLARQRTEGQLTLNRALALMLLLNASDEAMDVDKQKRYRMEVHEILLGLGDNAITRILMFENVEFSVWALSSLDCHTDISRLVDHLLDHVGKDLVRDGAHRRQQFLHLVVYRAGKWREFEIECLSRLARELLMCDLHGDAERVYARAYACAKANYGRRASITLHIQLQYLFNLAKIGNMAQLEAIAGEILMACSSGGLRCELYTSRCYLAVAAHYRGRHDEPLEICESILRDLRAKEDSGWEDWDAGKERLVIWVGHLFLEFVNTRYLCSNVFDSDTEDQGSYSEDQDSYSEYQDSYSRSRKVTLFFLKSAFFCDLSASTFWPLSFKNGSNNTTSS
ncbi:hypothetical protein F5X97DRAFT_317285 [Nemania serpens]|nr:hypothetical protein F5X97DRAFT_317285 [Nemania serpens]